MLYDSKDREWAGTCMRLGNRWVTNSVGTPVPLWHFLWTHNWLKYVLLHCCWGWEWLPGWYFSSFSTLEQCFRARDSMQRKSNCKLSLIWLSSTPGDPHRPCETGSHVHTQQCAQISCNINSLGLDLYVLEKPGEVFLQKTRWLYACWGNKPQKFDFLFSVV